MVLFLFFLECFLNAWDGTFLLEFLSLPFYCAAFLSPGRPLRSAATISTEAGLQVKWGVFAAKWKQHWELTWNTTFFFCQYPVIVLNECTRKYALFHQRSLSFVNLTQLFFLSVFNMFRHFGSRPETRQTSRKADLHACVRVKFLLAAQTLRFLSAAVESANEKNVNRCA